MSRQDEIRQGLFQHTVAGEAAELRALTEEGLALGMDPGDMLFGALMPGLQEVGRRFERREYFVPEMLVSAKAMQGALAILRPRLAAGATGSAGTVVMATVRGDLHDIGKNLCCIMLEGAGFHVVDLGINVPVDRIVAAAREHKASIIGLSAFLTTTMPMAKQVLAALDKEGMRDQVKVMIGGAPVTAEYANSVGADGYAPDASSTARLAKRLRTEQQGPDGSGGASR